MNITIIGTGHMAEAIGTRLLTGKQVVTILGKDQNKAKELAKRLGKGTSGGSLDTAINGEIVVLALPYVASIEIAKKYAEQLNKKIVVDISNPLDFQTFELISPTGSSAAEEIEKLLPQNTKLIKAFNTTFAQSLLGGVVDGKKTVVQMAGNNSEAKSTLKKVIEDTGMEAIDEGSLEQARHLEKTAQANIKALYSKK